VFVPAQCRLHAAVGPQHQAQRHRVFECLRRSLSRMRQHRMRRVANERDPSCAPVLERLTLEQYIETHVVWTRRCGDSSEASVEPRRMLFDECLRSPAIAGDISGEERQIPVDRLRTGARGRSFDSVSEIPHGGEVPEVVPDSIRDTPKRTEAARPRQRLVRMQASANY
jgi:hypothetical protein